jgi:disulfide bond formation protein DsbB
MKLHTQTTAAQLVWVGMHANICVICCILMSSLYIQVIMGEFPCPLCMVQRIAMMLCALGQAFALSKVSADGTLPCKDFMMGQAMTLAAALAGSIFAVRQILLHIVPPDPGYGSTVLGLHLYSWALLVFCCEIAVVCLCLMFAPRETFTLPPKGRIWTRRLLLLFGAVILAFGIATFVEEGLHLVLPDDPVSNRLFEDLGLTTPKPTSP